MQVSQPRAAQTRGTAGPGCWSSWAGRAPANVLPVSGFFNTLVLVLLEETEAFPGIFLSSCFFITIGKLLKRRFYWSLCSVVVARSIILNNYKQMGNTQAV